MNNRVFLRVPGGLAKALTVRYDDGVEQDVRLIEILDRHGIKATFNINSGCYSYEGKVFEPGRIHRRMSKSMVTKAYANSSHEVAVHGYSHPFLETLPPAEAAYEILEDRKNLEEQFGCIIRGMAYPYGTYNDTVVEILKNSGIVYSRTVQSTRKFKMPTDWLRLPATCHHNDPELMALAEKFVKLPSAEHPKMFYLWGHSYEFEENNNWDVIEKFCEYMGGRSDVWYATNIEIYEYTKAYEQLVWSADMSVVKNPTTTALWFEVSKFRGEVKLIKLEAGETKKIW